MTGNFLTSQLPTDSCSAGVEKNFNIKVRNFFVAP
jgi:hypothetical protein